MPRVVVAFALLALWVSTAAAQPPVRVDPAKLEKWPGHVDGGKVVVHAVDADGEALRAALAPVATAWITAPVNRRVSGQVATRTRATALAALFAAEPSLAIVKPRWRGTGANVDIDFRAAPTRDLFRLLADVTRTNVVMLAPSTNLTLRVKRVPAGAVLAEAARVAGLEVDRPASNVIVIRAPTAPRTPRLPARGPKLRLDAVQIRAAHLIELVRALDGPGAVGDATILCAAGRVIDLRLARVPTETAIGVIAVAGGVDLRGPRCGLPRLNSAADPTKLRLLATAERGTRKLAAVEVDGKEIRYVDDADDAWQVGNGWLVHHTPAADHELPLHDRSLADPLVPTTAARSIRLTATIIDGRTRLALVEVDGVPHVWDARRPVPFRDGLTMVEIQPGEIHISGDSGPEVLRLTPLP